MAAASWPSTLPQYVLVEGFEEAFGKPRIETATDAGKPKSRQRFTAEYRKFSMSVQMTEAQATIFETFYFDTLAAGTQPFDWVHPRTRASKTFYFRGEPPKMRSQGGEDVIVSFTLWMDP